MMFNFFLQRFPGERQPTAKRGKTSPVGEGLFLLIATLGLLAILSGCQTAPPLPPADLQAPGWEIRQGQALWKPRRWADGIAGEILIAIQKDSRTLLQFTKNPFPIISAGVGPKSWELEIPTQGKRYSHRGTPPGRVIWFQLLSAVAAQDLAEPWLWTSSDAEGSWRLENRTTGESLEGYFAK